MADDVKNVLVALGSPSDKKLIESEECKAFLESTKDSNVKFYLGIGSAHRTSWLVDDFYFAREWEVIIANAGLTNALASNYIEKVNNIKNFNPTTVVISVPISDSATGGLSSLLSGSELPPGYVGGVVGIDDMLSGLKFAYDITTTNYEKAVLLIDGFDDKKIIDDIEKSLKRFKVSYEKKTRDEIKDGKLDRNIITMYAYLGAGDNLSITFRPEPLKYAKINRAFMTTDVGDYVTGLDPGLDNVLHTGIANPTNFALMAAKIIARNNPEVADAIKNYLAEGVKKYEGYKELIQLN